jgi:hypothetical protein
MYTINRAPSRRGVTLNCTQCSHTVRVNEFETRRVALARKPPKPC